MNGRSGATEAKKKSCRNRGSDNSNWRAMNLFESQKFVMHSGEVSDWKIECDALTPMDLHTLAVLTAKAIGPFGKVEGVPSGGLKFAFYLSRFRDINSDVLVIVDDVLTTGHSMETHRAGRDAVGVVIFNRGKVDLPWVHSIFRLDIG